jgi:hydrogenase maturation protein HypF
VLEAEINISGRVQGVGFRPFVYRKAVKNGLKGYVINLGDAGVEIRVEGKEVAIKQFLEEIKKDAPNVSDIKNVEVQYKPYHKKFKKFRIEKSRGSNKSVSGIYPPDIGICEDCIKDMDKQGSRWLNYPFTACAWCGPRFTGIEELPYDRERTHMNKFSLCNYCTDEYFDPINRRFDAQGITCSICGPKMTLYDSNTSKINTKNIFSKSARMLEEGKILAIKGIGGVHLSTLSTNDLILEKLRIRKNRPNQPFALMSPNIKKIREIAYLNSKEETIISSWRKPIVLLKKKEGILSNLVAPGLDTVGIMLPYSGIHKMIFKNLKEPALVMTSGNKSGLPMAISNKKVFTELHEIADAFLLHNRKITNRCDDSILRIISGRKAFIRRSRGYVPDPIEIPFKNVHSISVGAELSNTGAVCNDGKCYPTQYIGDITNLESYEYEKNAIKTLRNLLNITCNPDVIGCDLHPGYMTSQMANEISQETETQIVTSQHHHAHIVSASVENEIDPDEHVVGIAMDGVGYGTDGAIWGGEVIISTFSDFERIGHLEYLPMPGGDLNTEYPVRMLISIKTRNL